MRSLRTLAVVAALASLPLTAVAADAPKAADADKTKVESIVHDYLLEHPEVIVQAVRAYQDKLDAEKTKAQQNEVAKRAPELLHDPASQVLGNAASDCAIVEFFDNQCPYCQANEPELQKLLKEDGRVKLVLKEFPILGPTSVVAAKAALASVKQGKYAQFHEALLGHRGHYQSEAVVDQVAKSVGLDLDKLHKDMEAPEIEAEIGKNLEAGRALDISGTPGFVIGNQVVDGASSLEDLKKYVADACKG